jgi:hypothetical protein
MPTRDPRERLRRLLYYLEDPHPDYRPANNDSILIHEASITHAQQIEALVIEYNNLEEAVYNLKQANASSGHEVRIKLLEK